MNKAILLGRLGRDPEFRTAGDKEVASMSLATEETYKDKNGERQKKTQWHRLTCWISIPFIRDYLHSGDCILVEGKIEYREWEDKNGNKKTSTEINVTDIKGLVTGGDGAKQQSSNQNSRSSKPAARPAAKPTPSRQVEDEDIPF